jgi:membrane glycosyltransferase
VDGKSETAMLERGAGWAGNFARYFCSGSFEDIPDPILNSLASNRRMRTVDPL